MASKPQFYAYIALGSNMGDREHFLLEAIRQLDGHEGIAVTGRSSVYETEPVGVVDQASFLNMVIEVKTLLSPHALFDVMVQTELELGRTRELRWGPRTIDLDLLMYEDAVQDDPSLILPHPRMLERAFVMIPLVEVLQACKSKQAAAMAAHLDRLDGKEGVTLWKKV